MPCPSQSSRFTQCLKIPLVLFIFLEFELIIIYYFGPRIEPVFVVKCISVLTRVPDQNLSQIPLFTCGMTMWLLSILFNRILKKKKSCLILLPCIPLSRASSTIIYTQSILGEISWRPLELKSHCLYDVADLLKSDTSIFRFLL